VSGRAFILRMNPAGVPRAAVGLQTNEISIGWGKCGAELLNTELDRSGFAMHVHRTYNAADGNRIVSGNSAGQLWRFIRAMSPGDLVVVPLGDRLHVAEVLGDASFDPNNEHWAYRRSVRWQTDKAGTKREDAGEQLRGALRSQMTCTDATHTLDDVRQLMA
jgi:predicted Mrr-cat superfamily restriction endonuclease